MIIYHNQPYLGIGIKHTRGNQVKGSNLTRIRGGQTNFRRILGIGGQEKNSEYNLNSEVINEFLDQKIVYSNC